LTRRVTRVPNRYRGKMLTHECSLCRELLPVTWPLGDATANDKPPDVQHEIKLAACIADACQLWESGADRNEIIERYVEGFASQPLSRMFPACQGTTQLAPTNVQCLACGRYGQRCDRISATKAPQ
jgi:hypothetical protein